HDQRPLPLPRRARLARGLRRRRRHPGRDAPLAGLLNSRTLKTIDTWRRHVRPAVAALEPYVWEMSSDEVAARYGVPADQVIRFDTNTSPFLPTNLTPTLAELAERMPLNEYPDTSYGRLAGAITAYTGFPAEQ